MLFRSAPPLGDTSPIPEEDKNKGTSTLPVATTTDDGPADPNTSAADPVTTTSTSPPAANNGKGVIAVGDSVMLGASSAITGSMPEIRLDAKVGRQFDQLLAVVDWYNKNGYTSGPVVVHLGTNGLFSDQDLDRLVEAAGDRKVVLVNAKVARPWQGLANERIAAAVKRHPNAVLADWFSLSSAHPEWFANDGVHLRPDGAAAFAELIRSNL